MLSFNNLSTICFNHGSYAHNNKLESNQRLEHLGDAILNAAVTDILYEKNIKNEHKMTVMRSMIVSNKNLTRVAKKLCLELHIKACCDITDKMLADTLEAVIGDYYLKNGFSATKDIIKVMFQL